MRVPFSQPSILVDDVQAVARTMQTGWIAYGPETEAFEEAFARRLGVPHAVAMNSCTSALEASLQLSGVRGEVILPSFTWVSVANAVVNSGATPVFADVDPATFNVTAALITERLTSRSEAVIVPHYGGQPAPIDEIVRLCDRHGLLLVEDCAETLGATWNGRPAGSYGVACFSFYPTKAITTGQGGMLTCHDPQLARRARAFITHGLTTWPSADGHVQKPWERQATLPGHNYRMPNMLAALGSEQLKRLDELNTRRQQAAARYDALLSPLASDLTIPRIAHGASHVYQMYTVRVAAEHRDGMLKQLWRDGVEASIHFAPPIHHQTLYAGYASQHPELPATDLATSEVLTIPIFPGITPAQQAHVASCFDRMLHDATHRPPTLLSRQGQGAWRQSEPK